MKQLDPLCLCEILLSRLSAVSETTLKHSHFLLKTSARLLLLRGMFLL